MYSVVTIDFITEDRWCIRLDWRCIILHHQILSSGTFVTWLVSISVHHASSCAFDVLRHSVLPSMMTLQLVSWTEGKESEEREGTEQRNKAIITQNCILNLIDPDVIQRLLTTLHTTSTWSHRVINNTDNSPKWLMQQRRRQRQVNVLLLVHIN